MRTVGVAIMVTEQCLLMEKGSSLGLSKLVSEALNSSVGHGNVSEHGSL